MKIINCSRNVTVDFASTELKRYICMLMPSTADIGIDYEGDGLLVGLMSDLSLDMSEAEDPALDDMVYIETKGEKGIIAGSNPVATLIAVYRYLRFCGIRWLFPGKDGEFIPIIGSLPDVSYRKVADTRYRGQCNEGAEYQDCMLETIDFSPKIGLNTYMLEFENPWNYYNKYYSHKHNPTREPEPVTYDTALQWKRECEAEIAKRGMHFHDMGHGWTALPFGLYCSGWTEYEGEVPDQTRIHLAQLDGKRDIYKKVPLNTNICMSNPETRGIVAKYVADYAEAHKNVDYLHIWLADAYNNDCECDNCRKKTVSDWYVMMLNDIDAELTKRGLDTRLVFIVYYDTFWAPKTETFNNPDRFRMLYAPITRTYSETYGEQPDPSAVTDFELNKLVIPKGMSACLAYLKSWKEKYQGDCFCYEYHFWLHQYADLSTLSHAEYLYRDIQALRKCGLKGMIQDGSQRSFFPHGFAYYLYGESMFDTSLTFEELKEDYFSHAYGEDYKKVLEYFEKIGRRLPYKHLQNRDFEYIESTDISDITAAFRAVADDNKNQKYRPQTVLWRLIREQTDYADKVAEMLTYRKANDEQNTVRVFDELKLMMGPKEVCYERLYDQYMCMHGLGRLLKPKTKLVLV